MNPCANTTLTACAILLAVSSIAPTSAGAAKASIGQIVVSASEFTAEEPNILRAFVPTLSGDACLTTLAESSYPTPGTTTFCGVRQVSGVNGIVVSIFLPEVPPSDAIWIVNIYQLNARGYGEPVPFPGD